MFAQREVVTAHLDFNRIAHGRKADEFDLGADEEAHFHETWAAGGGEFDLGDGGGSAQGDRGQRLWGRGHERSAFLGKGFDEDGLGQVLAEGDAGIADLANQAGMTADEADALFLAQSHLAQAPDDVRLRGQLLDANHRARVHRRKRTGRGVRATVRGRGRGFVTFFHWGERKSGGRGLQGGF